MSYSPDEIRALIDHWLTFRYSDRLWIRVRYADLSQAMDSLPKELAEVALITGLFQYTTRETAMVLDISKSTVARRYLDAVEWMADYLSGGRR